MLDYSKPPKRCPSCGGPREWIEKAKNTPRAACQECGEAGPCYENEKEKIKKVV